MKATTLMLFFVLLPFLHVHGQQTSAAYEQAMEQALAQMQSARSPETQAATLNTFGRIAEAMPAEWLPVYYQSLMRLNMAASSGNSKEKDVLLMEVLAALDAALQQHSANSELLALKGYHHLLYVAADPMNRGAQYSGRTVAVLEQAIAANPQNPRAYLLLGQMRLGMARFMNAPTTEACQLIAKANALYATATESSLLPGWGAGMARELMKSCP